MHPLPLPKHFLPVPIRPPDAWVNALLATGLRRLPDRWHVTVAALICSHLLRGQAVLRRWRELGDKRLCIAIRDTGNEWLFRITGTGLAPLPPASGDQSPAWDVRIHGDLDDFLALASRREDPDTLFFARRLSIEGDTELGLAIKNLLDSLDFDLGKHFSSVLGQALGARALQLTRRTGIDRAALRLLQTLSSPAEKP